ncbi:O-antigen ligase family protein [Flavobacterium sp. CYK-4]|uniref:O-antigen ligase family protein n=1 Tax=Flavobacterium lotistagni TaxID=2709660 RepID=UPI00140E7DE1|nr:O-antigen ligase family protein [Flavobacterium lotistagni]NHM07786.1 O-antigen ligase family protein [Flavobacterium lotistagni]
MLFVPVAFFFVPEINGKKAKSIIKFFSYGMVFFAIIFLIDASKRYFDTCNTEVFFHNELVPYDPGAIYMSVFASLAFFYFIQISSKSNIEQVCVGILCLLIFLLSSKSIITIDFIIVICYYAFFVKIPSGTKTLTIVSVTLFLFLSVFFVKEVRERFLIEYETAFIDNTLNNELTKDQQNVYNVSINEAWNKEDFHKNSFFPGTALRIYQLRIFVDLLQEQEIFWKGFGLEASQPYIREKAEQHNLDDIYKEYNFHNQYIQTFAELGIAGFLILIGMLLLNLKNALAHKDFLHIAFAITMIMLFLSESFFCRQRGIVFFIILYCLFNSVSSEKEAIKST